MKKSISLPLALLFIGLNLCGAQKNIPSDFVPKGYVLFEEYSGDLNNDDRKDYVLIIENTKEEDVVENRFGDKVDRNRRGIIVILDKENKFEKVVENRKCFLSENEDGGVYMPPELWIEIENNKLKIHYGHGRYGYWESYSSIWNPGLNSLGMNQVKITDQKYFTRQV